LIYLKLFIEYKMNYGYNNRPYDPTINTFSQPCTYGIASNQAPNAQYGVGSALGLAFNSISEANNNWNIARDTAIATGNYGNLPNGTHRISDNCTVKKGNEWTLVIDHNTGIGYGTTSDGKQYRTSGENASCVIS
jgi:hypothetical protein